MAYWIMKSEPGTWSWQDQLAAGTAEWDGVRNAQALKNMRAMRIGDRAFFYHSGKERRIVGLMEIARDFYPDLEDAKSGLVDVKALQTVPKPVDLATIKAEPALAELALVRQPRLSVMPVSDESWRILWQMAGL